MRPSVYGISKFSRATCGGVCLLASGLCGGAIATEKIDNPYQLMEYRAPDNSFSARLPSHWKVDEKRYETPGASFFGFGDSIMVYFYRATDAASEARQYLNTQTLRSAVPVPLVPVIGFGEGKEPKPNRPKVAGHDAWEIFVERVTPPIHNLPKQQFRERIVVVVMRTGFYSLTASCLLPAPCTWEVFEAFLASFRPGSAAQ